MSSNSPMPTSPIRAAALALVAALAASAAAQDAPGGPGKGAAPAAPPAGKSEPPAKAPAAKKERKVDPKAVEAIERYRKLLHLPANAGVKKVASRGEIALAMFPEPVVVRPRWTAADGFGLDVEIPDSVKEAYGPENVAMLQKSVGGYVALLVEPLFADVGRESDAYDLAVQPVKDDPAAVTVVLTPFDDAKARHERQKLVFGPDGLLRTSTVTPKLDADDPSAAMLAGVDIEMTVSHEKRGDRHVTKGFTALLPTGELKASIGGFWDGPGGLPLPKSIELVVPFFQEPIRVDLHDYAVDDKAVEGTARPKPEEPKPAEGKPGEGRAGEAKPGEEKPAEPAPKNDAPAPTPDPDRPRAELEAVEKQALRSALLLCIDRSGSMSGTKLAGARQAVLAAARTLAPEDRVAVLAFGDEPTWVAPFQSAGDLKGLDRRLSVLEAEGGTDLEPALREGFRVIGEERCPIRHVILLTDGATRLAVFRELVEGAASRGTTLSTVAIGDDADVRLLALLATWGGGRLHPVSDPERLPQIVTLDTTRYAIAPKDDAQRRREDEVVSPPGVAAAPKKDAPN